MNNFYLYGAGESAVSVIKYFGGKHISAIIDSDKERWGTKYFDIPVISLDEYRKTGADASILVTPYLYHHICGITETLGNTDISQYYLCPWMDRFYANSAELVDKLQLLQYAAVSVDDPKNPVLDALIDELHARGLAEGNGELIGSGAGAIDISLDNSIIRDLAYNGYSLTEDIRGLVKSGETNPQIEYIQKFTFRNPDLRQFKDIHKGKRCFIIGNGPSLRMEDLDWLHQHGEICFGVNKIYYAFENTAWRPDYYLVVDMEVAEHALSIMKDEKSVKFLRHFDSLEGTDIEKNYHLFLRLLQPVANPAFSFDLEKGLYNGNTVVYDAIEIAAYMGFSDIYLLGVDMTSGVRASDPNYHFYKGADPVSNVYVDSATGQARKLIGFAGQELEKRGQHLYNATRGGELEELPRVDFDSLFTE